MTGVTENMGVPRESVADKPPRPGPYDPRFSNEDIPEDPNISLSVDREVQPQFIPNVPRNDIPIDKTQRFTESPNQPSQNVPVVPRIPLNNNLPRRKIGPINPARVIPNFPQPDDPGIPSRFVSKSPNDPSKVVQNDLRTPLRGAIKELVTPRLKFVTNVTNIPQERDNNVTHHHHDGDELGWLRDAVPGMFFHFLVFFLRISCDHESEG